MPFEQVFIKYTNVYITSYLPNAHSIQTFIMTIIDNIFYLHNNLPVYQTLNRALWLEKSLSVVAAALGI